MQTPVSFVPRRGRRNRMPAMFAALALSLGCACAAPARAADAPAPPPPVPPAEAQAKAALDKTPRHGEWVNVTVPGGEGPLKCFVVYPERKEKAPVVIVIHEIYGASDWIRGVADQLAADGFIAVAPDLLSGQGPDGGGTESIPSRDDVVKLVRGLTPAATTADLNAVREYAMKIPAANGKVATMGFCWGGGASFAYAASQPELGAAVVFYGTSPADPAAYEKIKAPVLGLYGQNDARVDATIEPADAAMKKLGKIYVHHVYDGAGHGFMRAQDGQNGANARAAAQAWPAAVAFIREHVGK